MIQKLTKAKAIVLGGLFVIGLYLFSLILPVNEPAQKIKSTFSPKSSVEQKKARFEYFQTLLQDPATGQIPVGIRQAELEYAKTLPRRNGRLSKSAATQYTWKEAGPNDVGGRTRALAYDVRSSNVILAGGVSGGIWKSTDGGTTWALKNQPTDALSITSIAQDKRVGHQDTWYYCAGEFDGNSASDRGFVTRFYGNGVYKSTDNGETWTALTNTQGDPTAWATWFHYAAKVIVNDEGYLFFSLNGIGIQRSIDGGANFTTVLGASNDHYYSDIVEASDGTLIATISEYGYNTYFGGNPSHGTTPGVYKSTDNGGIWTSITPAGFPTVHHRSVIASAPSDPTIAYVFTTTDSTDGSGNEIVKLFKLNVTAGTGTDLSANLPELSARGRLKTQGSYDMLIAVKPDDPNFVLIAGTSLFRSTDGFSTKPSVSKTDWIGGYSYDASSFFYPGLHPDVHSFAFDPNDPKKVIIGTDGGLSLASDITTTTYSIFFPWVSLNNGYNVTQFYTAALKKASGDNSIMGGAQDNGTPSFTFDGLVTSSSEDISSGDGSYCYFAKSYAYISYQSGGLFRVTYNAGVPGNPFTAPHNDWSFIKPTGSTDQLFINPFVVDPSNEDIMYYLAGSSLYRNNMLTSLANGLNGTSTGWTNMTNFAAPTNYKYTCLAASEDSPRNVLYLGAYKSGSAPKIFRIANADTASSGIVDISIPGIPAGSYIHRFAINPKDANEVIAVHSNYKLDGLYRTTDGGQSWVSIEGNLIGNGGKGPSIRSAVIMPTNIGNIYVVGTSTGIYSTTNLNGSLTTWEQEAATSIGNVVVEYLYGRISDGRIAAATHGRGMFFGDLTTATDVKDGEIVPEQFSLSQNYPNPFNPSTTVNYRIAKAGKVVMKVYDMLGKEVSTLVNEVKSPGSYNVTFNASSLSSGIYIYRIATESFVASKKMTLLK